MSKGLKILTVVIIVLCCAIGAFVWYVAWLFNGSITKTDLKYYEEHISGNGFMPNLESLPEYEDIRFKYYHKNNFIFESDAYTLIVTYDEKTYQEEKDKLDQKYYCQEEPLNDWTTVPKEPEFTLGTFYFRVLSEEAYQDEYHINYPKIIFFIGTSDETQEIAYIEFYDTDLDLINSLQEFLVRYCDWEVA